MARMATRAAEGRAQRPRKRPPMSRPRGPRQAERRAAILAAALDEFSASGFAAARLDDVARRAGVAKGTIYLYFRDKEALFQELIRAVLSPLITQFEAVAARDVPVRVLAEEIIALFEREIYATRRKDVIRLIIAEGPRFPKLAAFYYTEVLSKLIAAARARLARAAERREPGAEALMRFPQLLIAPGLVAILWSGLFERFEPLDVGALMRAHLDLMFGAGRGK